MHWFSILMVLGVAVLATFVVLAATQWKQEHKISTREIYVPVEVVKEVEKIIRVTDETWNSTDSKEVLPITEPEDKVADFVSPSVPLYIDHVLFMGTPSSSLKAWVKSLPLANDVEVVRLNSTGTESEELYYHLMAMTKFSRDCMLVVDSRFQPNKHQVHVEHGPMQVISKQPPVYLLWHYQAKDWSDRLLKRYRSRQWMNIFDESETK